MLLQSRLQARILNPLDLLSARERQVASLAAAGLATKEIGLKLSPRVSAGTVKTHLKDIYQKLGIHSRAELGVLWERWNAG